MARPIPRDKRAASLCLAPGRPRCARGAALAASGLSGSCSHGAHYRLLGAHCSVAPTTRCSELAIYAPDDTVTAISIFDDLCGRPKLNRRGLAWIEQNLAPLLTGPATAVAGPVIVHTLA